MRSRIPSFSLAFCLASVCVAQQLPTYTLKTFAGTGEAGYAGDGAAASAAQMNYPTSMARTTDGTLYIADTFNHRIRSITANGNIQTVVGTGTRGLSGDNATATSALISSPYGVAVDKNNVLYFSDTRNHMIRKVTSGTAAIIAGTGAQGSTGDGDDAKKATLSIPTSLAVDQAGNVYFTDTLNHRIRKIGTDGKISTIAGNGSGKFSGDGGLATAASLRYPEGLAFDAAGNLYVSDTFNHRIRKIDLSGIITTVAGTDGNGYSGDGGAATAAMLNYPRGVYVDGSGVIYIADTYNSRIRAVTEDGKIHLIAGAGFFGDNSAELPATAASLRFPRAVLPDGAGGFFVLDTDNSKIKRLVPDAVAPLISQGGVVSLSEFGGFTKAAPGSWLEIYGANLAQGTRGWEASDFVDGQAPTDLSGTSVTIGGRAAYISYISPGQVNVQVPDTVPVGEQEIVITSPAGSSEPYKFTFETTQPGLFAPHALAAEGRRYAGVLHADGSLVGESNPPRPGETVTLYGIGFGGVAPHLTAGEVVRSANSVVEPLKVYIGGTEATVTYAGLAPGTLGLYQINVVIPQVDPNSSAPLTFELSGEPGQQTLYTVVGR